MSSPLSLAQHEVWHYRLLYCLPWTGNRGNGRSVCSVHSSSSLVPFPLTLFHCSIKDCRPSGTACMAFFNPFLSRFSRWCHHLGFRAQSCPVVEPLGLAGMGCVQPLLTEAPAATGHLHLIQSKTSETIYIKARRSQKKGQTNPKHYIVLRYALV